MSVSSVDTYVPETTGRPDMNLATESKRILYVLDKTIQRSKFVGVLKSLVSNDGDILSSILNSDDHFYFVQICRKYEFTGFKFSNKKDSIMGSEAASYRRDGKVHAPPSRSSAASDVTRSTIDEDQDSNSSDSDTKTKTKHKVRARVDNELSKIILMLESYPRVLHLAKELENEISPQMRFFIRCLKEIRDGVALHLGESAAQEKSRQAYLRECYVKNEKAKREIERLEGELKEHKTDANYCIIGRNVLINRHQRKIDKIKKASAEAIEKRVKESEKAMANDWKASTLLQETLKEEYLAIKQKFDTLLRDDLTQEKQLRAKRAKVENQLLGWLQKFDQDIGEKQAQEEEIQALLDDQNRALQKIQLKLEEQEEEYDELMQEKAEYELEMLERRLYFFILNRSARRIQRFFRIYKAKKLAKKKGKGKGKKGAKK